MMIAAHPRPLLYASSLLPLYRHGVAASPPPRTAAGGHLPSIIAAWPKAYSLNVCPS